MFCSECGARLAAPQPEPAAMAERPLAGAAATGPNTCPDCGAQLAEGDEFCYACGADLRQRAAAGVAPEPSEAAPPSSPPVEAVPPPLEEAGELPAPAATEASAEAVPAPTPPYPAAALDMPEPLRECPACGAEVAPGDA
jgi:DNA-directed RNA polymerase subunit RPC12/RpoP